MKIARVVLALAIASTAAAQTSQLQIDVDARVEAFSVVQFIGERMNNGLPTRYARDVHAHFDRFRDHRAVRLIRAIVPDGLSWGIPAALGLAVDSIRTMRVTMGLPVDITSRTVPLDTIAMYVDAVRDFVAVTGFQEFFRAHRTFYEALALDTQTRMGTEDYLGEVERFWGGRQALYAIHLSPLMPAGGVAPSVERRDGSIEVHSILGATSVRDSIPSFGNGRALRNLVLHEFSHSFVNRTTARFRAQVAQWEVLMSPVRNRLRQADGLSHWEQAVNELVIRAFTANMLERSSGDSAARESVSAQAQVGFVYLPRFREWLREYEGSRQRWRSFADYYPTLLAHFAELAGSHLVADSVEPPFRGDFSMARWVNEEFFFVFIIPTGERDRARQDSLHAMVRQIRDNGYRESMIVLDVDALGQDLSRFSVWAWGTPDGNLWLREHRERLPLRVFTDSIVAGDSTILGRSLLAIMALRNPQNPRYPLLVSTGQRIEEVSRAYWNWGADYAIMDGDRKRLSGIWPVKTEAFWGFTARKQ